MKKLSQATVLLLIALIVCSSFFLFSRLGDRNMGVDEPWYVIHAENILYNGYPLVTKTFNFLPYGYVPSHDSWLSFYVSAGFYQLFGVNDFTSRLPFALFGLATLLFLPYFTYRLTKKKSIAIVATTLLASSYLFYIHSRYARYFSLVMLLTLLLVYSYLRLLESSHKKYDIFFILINIIYFYTHIQLWAYCAIGLFAHFMLFSFSKKTFFRLTIGSLIAFLSFIPWLYYWLVVSNTLSDGSISSTLFSFVFKLAVSFFYFFLIVFPLVFLLFIFKKDIRKTIFFSKTYLPLYFVILSTLILLPLIGWNPLPEVRKIVTVTLPLIVIPLAHLLILLYKKSKLLGIVLAGLFIFTNLLHLASFAPLYFIPSESIPTQYESTGFLDNALSVKLSFFDLLYEVSHDYQSIHDVIFPTLASQGLYDVTIVTDVDLPQLNYQSFIRDANVSFISIEEEGVHYLNKTYYLLNYDDNKAFYLENLQNPLILAELDDYQEAVWIDSTNPIYRRYYPHPTKTMLLIKQ